MNGLTMMCSSLGAVVLAATGVMVGPPPAAEDAAGQPTRETRIFLTREIEVVDPPKGRWEAILQPIGTLNIVVDEHGLRVQLNNEWLHPNRIAWQSDNFLMIFDEMRQRQFQVKLGKDSKIEAVRPGSWLNFRSTSPSRVAIGVFIAPLTPALATQLGLDLDAGLLVHSVIEDMPAFKSGVQQFDVITAVDNEMPVSEATLRQVVSSKDAGQTIELHLIRRAQPLTLSVAVEAIKPLEPGDFFPGIPQFTGEWPDADLIFDPTAAPVGDDPFSGIPRDENPVIRFDRDGTAVILPSQIVRRNVGFGEQFPRTFQLTGTTEYRGDVNSLEQKIDSLTARIASLEALIARLMGDPTEAEDAVPIEDRP